MDRALAIPRSATILACLGIALALLGPLQFVLATDVAIHESIFGCLKTFPALSWILLSILAISFSRLARRKIRKATGKTKILGIAGLVTGYVSLAPILITVAAIVLGLIIYGTNNSSLRKTRTLAEGGNALFQQKLGGMYYSGNGVEEDRTIAVTWFRKAAEGGYTKAQLTLGLCYHKGEGVTQNHAEAVKWFRKAAEGGYLNAQYALGVCYQRGEGVSENYTEAVKWFRKAAEGGYAKAQHALGSCYYDAKGVLKDHTEAVKWYRKAALQRHPASQYNLGLRYFYGEGIGKDIIRAYAWLLVAELSGEEVVEAKTKVAEHLLQPDLEEAEKLAIRLLDEIRNPTQ